MPAAAKPARKRHSRFSAFESLSPKGQAMVIEGLEKDLPQETIRMRLAGATGEDFSKGSLGRFAQQWRLQRGKEAAVAAQARRIVDGMKASNVEAGEAGQAMIFQALLETADEAGELDVEKIHKLNIRYNSLRQDQQELELKRKTLTLKEEALKLAQQRLTVLEARMEAVRTKAQAIEKAASQFTEIPSELRAQVRELFGLTSEVADAA